MCSDFVLYNTRIHFKEKWGNKFLMCFSLQEYLSHQKRECTKLGSIKYHSHSHLNIDLMAFIDLNTWILHCVLSSIEFLCLCFQLHSYLILPPTLCVSIYLASRQHDDNTMAPKYFILKDESCPFGKCWRERIYAFYYSAPKLTSTACIRRWDSCCVLLNLVN